LDGGDWRAYDEGLVRRGEILLDLDLMDGWEEELEAVNRPKEGARFQVDPLIRT